ncbi:MAG: selenide, water dikinase SelD, partial [Bacteroidetes bacterium]|nr:selenide, water dikinase SelD [Bacteroidota bacterium]
YPNITTKNFNAYSATTHGLNGLEFITLCDPQTSGGLLISVAENSVDEYQNIIKQFNPFNVAAKPIGRMVRKGNKTIYVNN